jgi:predicted MPP superfamily phosphohydrolase
MTAIRILSDLHLENHQLELEYLDEDILLLVGDVYSGLETPNKVKNLIRNIPHEVPVLFVPGNHEYYSVKTIDELNKHFRKEFKNTQVVLMNNKTVEIQGIRFIGSTLWTTFEWKMHSEERIEFNMQQARTNINDFFHIKGENGRFTVEECRAMGQRNVKWIERQLKKKFDGQTVVMTHFVPFLESIDPRYSGNSLNPYFTNDLGHLFGKCDLWVHGHTHSSCDYTKNGTRVICNPRGYYGECNSFRTDLIVEM